LNGFGGKVHANETEAEAASRELWEESTLKVCPTALIKQGTLLFDFEGLNIPNVLHVSVFSVSYSKALGVPSETEEMAPQWYPLDSIPFESMWPDDRLWMPYLLKGNAFSGQIWFSSDQTTILKHDFTIHEAPFS
jgi:8-oxo-dGTP pyrophosphatase MutT (NUDIX family)